MPSARLLLPLLVLALGAPALATADDAARIEAEYEQLRAAVAPALVNIKYVQKTQSRFGDFDGESEIQGVMVDPGGLVLCSNALLGGGRRGGGRAVPIDIKILIGNDTRGLDATFVARDTELDLAWLQIKSPGERRFTHLDLVATAAQPPRPRLGQRVLSLGMMGKFFGQELLVTEGVIAGRTHKPRELYVVRGALDTDPGLPIFTAEGKVVGFATVQQPDPDELSGSNPAGLVTRGRGLILPVATVVKATERARELVARGVSVPPTEPATETDDDRDGADEETRADPALEPEEPDLDPPGAGAAPAPTPAP